jgi:hypothetical protein
MHFGPFNYYNDSSTVTLISWFPLIEVEIIVIGTPELISFTDRVITGRENFCPSTG